MGIRDEAKRWYVKQHGVVRQLDPLIKNRGKLQQRFQREADKGKNILKKTIRGGKRK